MDGYLYRLGQDGDILKIDLAKRTVASAGRLSASAATSSFATVSWTDSHVSVLFAEDSGDDARLQTYSIKNGDIVRDIPVRGLGRVFRGEADAFPWAMATVNQTAPAD